jgi:hypothetical protein
LASAEIARRRREETFVNHQLFIAKVVDEWDVPHIHVISNGTLTTTGIPQNNGVTRLKQKSSKTDFIGSVFQPNSIDLGHLLTERITLDEFNLDLVQAQQLDQL